MPRVDIVVETKLKRSTRVKQLEAMFDVPPSEKCKLSWSGDMPIEKNDWQIGLIVGPSGSGKSTVLNEVFRPPTEMKWGKPSVVDDFSKELSMEDISRICQAVGFNTIPAWMRPYAVLSNGEKFRVELARRMLEDAEPVIVDEFTSVVDRQVAKIGAHAVQKFIRKGKKKLIAASCHYDVIDWLQPDWIFEPGTMTFRRRLLRPRPKLDIEISWVPKSAWALFAPFHYMSAEMHPGATGFGMFVEGRIAAFAGVLHRQHPKVNDIKAVTRLVTLPDWQGLGLSPRLVDRLGACHKAIGKRLRCYPAHPALVRSFSKSKLWEMKKRAGTYSETIAAVKNVHGSHGGRPCGVFEYCGEAHDRKESIRLLERQPRPR